MRTLICIPTFNERENLPAIVKELLNVSSCDLVILDDESPDGTGALADQVAKENLRVKVVHRTERRGLFEAYRDGFKRALELGYDAVVQMDADFSHQPRYLPELLTALEHADVAVGSRYIDEGSVATWGLLRKALSVGGNTYARLMLGAPFRDWTSGFVAYRRHVLEAIDLDTLDGSGAAFQIELKFRAFRLGFSVVEVPIAYFDRVAGVSKLQHKGVAEALWRVMQLRMVGFPRAKDGSQKAAENVG